MSSGKSIKRVGILFSGGPAPAANAVISAATLSFINSGISVVGFYDGFKNLERFSAERPLVERSGLRVPDARRRVGDPQRGARSSCAPRVRIRARRSARSATWPIRRRTRSCVPCSTLSTRLEIDALVSLGGDDTLKTANYLYRMQEAVPGLRRVRVVHLPKTIDNDYYGIDWTFGFMSAANSRRTEIRNIGCRRKIQEALLGARGDGPQRGMADICRRHRGRRHEDHLRGRLRRRVRPRRRTPSESPTSLTPVRKTAATTVSCASPKVSPTDCPTSQRPPSTDEHGNTVLASRPDRQDVRRGASRSATSSARGCSMEVMRHKQTRLRGPLHRADGVRHHARLRSSAWAPAGRLSTRA